MPAKAIAQKFRYSSFFAKPGTESPLPLPIFYGRDMQKMKVPIERWVGASFSGTFKVLSKQGVENFKML